MCAPRRISDAKMTSEEMCVARKFQSQVRPGSPSAVVHSKNILLGVCPNKLKKRCISLLGNGHNPKKIGSPSAVVHSKNILLGVCPDTLKKMGISLLGNGHNPKKDRS